MQLPRDLTANIDRLCFGISSAAIKKTREEVTDKYGKNLGGGRLVTTGEEVVSYCASRMPATYCAVKAALLQSGISGEKISSVCDVGAGTGAAVWAADGVLSPSSFVCLERETEMLRVGKLFSENAISEALKSSVWLPIDIVSENALPSADMVTAAYFINEIAEDRRIGLYEKLLLSTKKLLLIVETGTPRGFSIIAEARKYFLENGMFIISPCPHDGVCPIAENEWCHFYCRVERSKLHKAVKDGEAPYEDEKFSYVLLSKFPQKKGGDRILRHPIIMPKRISVRLCTASGRVEERSFTKSSPSYKLARKAKCGDLL